MQKQEKRVETIAQVDFSEVHVPVIGVYKYPEDFPQEYVARVFDGSRPTNVIMIADTLDEIMEDIGSNTDLVFTLRGAEDVPSLVGAWI